MPIVPEDKDWTWVLEQACLECGFDARSVSTGELASVFREGVAPWRRALTAEGVRTRPDAGTWSPLEYAAHLRDALGQYRSRVAAMLITDGARFDDWDQDAAAVAASYDRQDPAVVADELAEALEAAAETFEAVPGSALVREGLRGDGARFTIDSLTRYFAHEVVHHLHDASPA